MAIDYDTLSRIIRETDASYASGNDAQKQAAVAARDAAVAQWTAQGYQNVGGSTPATSSGGSSPPPPPPPPAPVYPRFVSMKTVDRNVKVAPSDIIQWDDSNTSVALMQDLLFEDIGAVELANISRTDLIDGQQTIYSPIKNLSTVRREFNPNNIILTTSNNDYFTRFGIDLTTKTIYEPYFNSNGDLVIEIDGLVAGEEIEVEILSSGTISTVEEP